MWGKRRLRRGLQLGSDPQKDNWPITNSTTLQAASAVQTITDVSENSCVCS